MINHHNLKDIFNKIAPSYNQIGSNKQYDFDLSKGEIGFEISNKFIEIQNNQNFEYGNPLGEIKLRNQYLKYFNNDSFLNHNNTMVTIGAKHACSVAFSLLVVKHDNVLIPSPGWAVYKVHTQMQGANPIEYNPAIEVEELINSIESNKIKVVILNNPNNPTGHSFSKEDLSKLVDRFKDDEVNFISDEVYKIYSDDNISMMPYLSILKNKLIICDSISKLGPFAGLRVGFLTSTEEIIRLASLNASAIYSCPSVISQSIASLIFKDANSIVEQVKNETKRRLNLLNNYLLYRGVDVESSGAIYSWVNVKPQNSKLFNSVIKGTSGEVFQKPNYIRLCPMGNNTIQFINHIENSL